MVIFRKQIEIRMALHIVKTGIPRPDLYIHENGAFELFDTTVKETENPVHEETIAIYEN